MHKKWVVSAKKADFNDIAKRFGISPYLARIIRNRDVCGDEAIDRFLNGDLSSMHNPSLLTDIDAAADILYDAIISGTRIRIVGDYDVDGVCASYILKKSITLMGGDVDVRLPDRVSEGYGINEIIIDEAYNEGVELIVTCDNGIAAYKEIEKAENLGISVIVTDHHEVPYEGEGDDRRYIIPPADAVVDPKRSDCTYPFEGICGAMVTYKLVTYMLRNPEYEFEIMPDELEEHINEILSFAAFATIEDVMELVDENRVAVKYGLEILRRTKNVGMKALIDVTGLDPSKINVYQIGFVLGPCINSTGRLESAARALELFLETDSQRAVVIAQELKELNDSRKNMTNSFAAAAIETVKQQYGNDKVIVVYLKSCHESIAGIVAGRIREAFYRPVIVLTDDNEGNLKGSGRSIESYSLFEELSKVKDMFTKFGGHRMAAGLSMQAGLADELRRRLNENCTLSEEDLVEKSVIDIPMPMAYVTKEFVEETESLAPFGVSNPRPLFAEKNVTIKNRMLVGKNQNVLKLRLQGKDSAGNTKDVDAVIFDDAQGAYSEIGDSETISILYQIGLNEYMGNTNVQLIIKDYFI